MQIIEMILNVILQMACSAVFRMRVSRCRCAAAQHERLRTAGMICALSYEEEEGIKTIACTHLRKTYMI